MVFDQFYADFFKNQLVSCQTKFLFLKNIISTLIKFINHTFRYWYFVFGFGYTHTYIQLRNFLRQYVNTFLHHLIRFRKLRIILYKMQIEHRT